MRKRHACSRAVGWLGTAMILACVAAASGQSWSSRPAGDAGTRGGDGPPNDLCENAIEITATPYYESNIQYALATPDIDVSCNSPDETETSYGFWYRYTPAVDCDAFIAAGSFFSPPLAIAVFTGPDCANLTEVYCAGGQDLDCTLDAGVTYWILVGSWDSKPGSDPVAFYLECSSGACCVGQDCTIETPTVCAALGGIYVGDGTTCTPGLCETGACCFADGSCAVLTPDDCANSGGTWSGGSTNCAPNRCPQPPAGNDLCTDAIDITSVPFADLNVDTSYATPDIDSSCDSDGCDETGYGIWYTYTPTEYCDVHISIEGVTGWSDHSIAIFTGGSCDKLTEIACSTDQGAVFPAEPGVKYWILVGQYKCYGLPSTNIDFHLYCTKGACCVGEDCSSEGETSCLAKGGNYVGDDTVCQADTCLTGACCFVDGACQTTSAADCAALGGFYHGGGTTCDPNPCSLPGDDCDNPLPIELPLQLDYTDANQTTCGRGNSIWSTCLWPYDGGEEIVYLLTVTDDICIDVTVVGNTPDDNYFGLSINDTCPAGDSCLAGAVTTGAEASVVGLLLAPGAYYLMVDSWPPPYCLTDFTLTINASSVCAFGACCAPKNGCYDTYQELCEAAGGVFAGPGTTCDPTDCQGNGTPDVCDIALGLSTDCQGNGVPDECDLADGTSLDGDQNGVPDECDLDCNGNGVPDACELPGGCATGDCSTAYPAECGTGSDCDQNGLLDECDIAGTVPGVVYANDDGTRETNIGIPAGSYLAALSQYVVVEDGALINSINVAWGDVTDGTPVTVYIWADPTQDGDPDDAYVIGQGAGLTANAGDNVFNEIALDVPTDVGPTGTIFFVGFTLFSDQYPIALDYSSVQYRAHWLVGNSKNPIDPNNLGDKGNYPELNPIEYAGFYGRLMIRAHGAPVADCNGNGVPDACDVPPLCADGPPFCSADCNGNLIPDECELAYYDCNANGIPDDCDIAAGVSADCDLNGIPDECDMAACDGSPWCSDCNGNGIMDFCDILNCDGNPDCSDCNVNGIPDACDIADCQGEPWCSDCQGDGIPDICQLDYARGGGAVLYEDFESGVVPPPGWTALASTPATWEIWQWGAYEGTYLATCQYDSNYTDVQDEWLISPELNASGMLTLSGFAQGSIPWGVDPNDNYDVEAWVVIGPKVNDGNDVLLGRLDDVWPPDYGWGEFNYDFAAPVDTFRIGFRYHGYDGAAGGIDLIQLAGQSGVPSNDCNANGIPDECDLCGDLDSDGDVDHDDYVIFLEAFGGPTDGEPAVDWCCDYDGSGAVGLLDFAAWLECYRDYVGNPFAPPPSKKTIAIEPRPSVSGPSQQMPKRVLAP